MGRPAPLCLKRLKKAVKKIVAGIRNSIKSGLNLTTLKVAKASVIEWPIVKAVTRISTFFQSLMVNSAVRAITNRI